MKRFCLSYRSTSASWETEQRLMRREARNWELVDGVGSNKLDSISLFSQSTHTHRLFLTVLAFCSSYATPAGRSRRRCIRKRVIVWLPLDCSRRWRQCVDAVYKMKSLCRERCGCSHWNFSFPTLPYKIVSLAVAPLFLFQSGDEQFLPFVSDRLTLICICVLCLPLYIFSSQLESDFDAFCFYIPFSRLIYSSIFYRFCFIGFHVVSYW